MRRPFPVPVTLRGPAVDLARRAAFLLFTALLAAAALGAAPAAAAPADGGDGLDEAERRGKRIYLTGESPSGGEVTALMGDGAVPVPATALPCASCHGRDGRGRPEGGVEPSDLTWEALTRPYEITRPDGRRRGPYTPRLLTRAIGMGVDASGNRLDTVMPRYRMSRQDSADLVAYLRKLGRDRDPGVGEETLDVGVLLPPRGVPGAAATAAAIGRVTDAYTRRLNAGGGVYGRSLRLHYRVLPDDPAVRPAALRDFVAETPLFALVASYTVGAEAALADTAEALELPLVGALGLHPDESFPLNRQVFHLDGGLPAQARALLAAAAQRAAVPRTAETTEAAPRLAVVAPPEGPLADLATEIAAVAEEHSPSRFATVVQRSLDPAHGPAAVEATARALADADEWILLLPGEAASSLVAALPASTGRTLHVNVPGSLAGPLLAGGGLPSLPGGVAVAYNSLPGDRTAAGREWMAQRLDEAVEAPGSTEIHAFLAMDTLVQGLEATGRDLTREGLLGSLELVRTRPTGLGRPLSFGVNRRVGSRGAYVVELEPTGSGSTNPEPGNTEPGQEAALEPRAVRWFEAN